jgi:hypothetical protein
MKCDTARDSFALLLYGELSFEEEELLERHLGECDDCRVAFEAERRVHQALDGVDEDIPLPLLVRCRKDLAARLESERSVAVKGFWGRVKRHLPLLAFPAGAFAKPVAAVALVALGVFGARIFQNGMPFIGGQHSAPPPATTRVRFVDSAAPGQVKLILEETRQRVVSGSPDEAPIRELLLAAAADPSDPGLRVDSMDLPKTHSGSADVRRTLLFALQNDTNAGVRLKAIEGLKSFAGDDEMRQVLCQVLLNDDNPGVRTQAIDLLAQAKGPDIVGTFQELMRREHNNYIRLRSQRALREMNASVETF